MMMEVSTRRLRRKPSRQLLGFRPSHAVDRLDPKWQRSSPSRRVHWLRLSKSRRMSVVERRVRKSDWSKPRQLLGFRPSHAVDRLDPKWQRSSPSREGEQPIRILVPNPDQAKIRIIRIPNQMPIPPPLPLLLLPPLPLLLPLKMPHIATAMLH